MTHLLFLLISIYLLTFIVLSAQQSLSAADGPASTNADTNMASNDELFTIEHSVDGKTFSSRSNFKIQFSQGNKVISVDPEKNGIFQDNADKFKALLQDNGFYRIRISSQLGVNNTVFVMASVPACELQKSGFKEDISVHLDVTNSFIIGLSYSSPVIAISRTCNPSKFDVPQLLLTRVKIADRVQAQSIPLTVSGPRPRELEKVRLWEDDETETAKQQQNTSFLRRYWYLVIPMMLFMLLPTDSGRKAEGGTEKKNQ